MRFRWLGCACFLFGVLLLNPDTSPGQPGGGRGGFGGKSFNRGGPPDPDRIFGFIAKNGDVIDFGKMDANQRRFASMMFERNGLPVPSDNAVISRAQFVESFTRAQAARGGSSGGGPGNFQGRSVGSPPGGAPGGGVVMTIQNPGGGPPQWNIRGQGNSGGSQSSGLTDERIQELFTQYDRNKDGKIEYEEASDRTKPDFKEADSNNDSGLDLTEYRAYVQKKFGGGDSNNNDSRSDRSDRNGNDRNDSRRDPNQKEEPEIYAIRYGKLPDGLPSWWNELDSDRDGQVGLYEWREGGRDLQDFLVMDLNTDGLLAPQEMLRYTVIKEEKDKLLAAQAAEEGFEFPTTPGSSRSSNGGRTNGGGRTERRESGPTGNRGPWGGGFQPKGGGGFQPKGGGGFQPKSGGFPRGGGGFQPKGKR